MWFIGLDVNYIECVDFCIEYVRFCIELLCSKGKVVGCIDGCYMGVLLRWIDEIVDIDFSGDDIVVVFVYGF